MTGILLVCGLLLLGLGTTAIGWRKARVGWLARQRVESVGEAAVPPGAESMPLARPFRIRHRLLPWTIGLLAAGLAYFVFSASVPFVVAAGLIIGLLGGQLESHLAAKLALRIETQLADAIDLMVAALGAGAGVSDALESASRESRRPLRPQLEDVIGRIRLGDDPQAVYRNLAASVPLETFLLFSSALSVHSETGGSLAPTLASAGRTIRDRIEISRRIRSNSTQSEVSTWAVLGLTYFIALVMWRTNPEQVHKFLDTSAGQWTVAGAVLLQAIGLVWMSLVSRLRF